MKVMNESCIKVYNKKQQKILKQMNENSKKWHDANNRFEKDRLHQANVELAGKLGGTVWYDSYTGTWNGNAAHIDLEAWTAEWENHYRSGVHAGTGAVCSSCDVWNGRKAHFCPFCGKAMTPEALAMLEKRLRGGRSETEAN